jgi:formylglycine-generating enzyme required for sulfatase activity
MSSDWSTLETFRRELADALEDAPTERRAVVAAAGLDGLLRALAQVHAAAVAVADAAEELVELSLEASGAHLAAAHRAADEGAGTNEALRSHVVEAFAATEGAQGVAAFRRREAWLRELVVTLDRDRLGSRLEPWLGRRPRSDKATASRSRFAPELLLELEVARVRDGLAAGARSATVAPIRAPSWLYVPALEHVVGADPADADARVDEGPPIAVALPAFWIARRSVPARRFHAATVVASGLGAVLPTELCWEAAVRLHGPRLARGPRWEWCSDAHDRRLLLRAAAGGALDGQGACSWRAARTLGAPTRRRRLPTEGEVDDTAVRPIRAVRSELTP